MAKNKFDLSIREALENDARPIYQLVSELEYKLPFPDFFANFQTWLQAEDKFIFLAENHGQPIGFISFSFETLLRFPSPRVIIEELIVSDQHRGENIGSALLERAVKIARNKGAGMIDVRTNPDRESAKRGFYEKRNFEPVHTQVLRLKL